MKDTTKNTTKVYNQKSTKVYNQKYDQAQPKVPTKSTTKSNYQLAKTAAALWMATPCSWLRSTKGQQSVRSITSARKLGGQLGKASDEKPRLW